MKDHKNITIMTQRKVMQFTMVRYLLTASGYMILGATLLTGLVMGVDYIGKIALLLASSTAGFMLVLFGLE